MLTILGRLMCMRGNAVRNATQGSESTTSTSTNSDLSTSSSGLKSSWIPEPVKFAHPPKREIGSPIQLDVRGSLGVVAPAHACKYSSSPIRVPESATHEVPQKQKKRAPPSRNPDGYLTSSTADRLDPLPTERFMLRFPSFPRCVEAIEQLERMSGSSTPTVSQGVIRQLKESAEQRGDGSRPRDAFICDPSSTCPHKGMDALLYLVDASERDHDEKNVPPHGTREEDILVPLKRKRETESNPDEGKLRAGDNDMEGSSTDEPKRKRCRRSPDIDNTDSKDLSHEYVQSVVKNLQHPEPRFALTGSFSSSTTTNKSADSFDRRMHSSEERRAGTSPKQDLKEGTPVRDELVILGVEMMREREGKKEYLIKCVPKSRMSIDGTYSRRAKVRRAWVKPTDIPNQEMIRAFETV